MSFPVLLSNPVNRSHPLNRGRLAWYLDLPGWDGGQRLYDLLGRYPGTLTGGPAWSGTTRPGGFGHLHYDGVSAYVTAGSVLHPATFTYAAWVKVDVFTAGNTRGYPTICGVYNDGAGQPAEALFDFEPTGRLNVFVYGVAAGSYIGQIPTSPLDTNTWYHVATTYDGGTTPSAIKVYVNGLPVVCTPQSGGTFDTHNTGTTNPFLIGAANTNDAPNYFFDGAIDDVGVWSRPLSAQEMRSLYDLSRRGYPGLLNRLDPARLSAPPAATGATGAATLASASSLAATGSVAIAGAAALVSAPAQAASGSLAIPGAASLTGVSTQAAAASLAIPGAAALASTSTLAGGAAPAAPAAFPAALLMAM